MGHYGYITLVFFLILAFIVLNNGSQSANILKVAGTQTTNQILALQGRGSGYGTG